MTSEDSSASSGVEYFQRLADGSPVMIWLSGHDMGCFYFNRAWLDFVGRTLEQEFGNGWAEGVHPEDLERCVNHYVGCFKRRLSFAMSYRLRDRGGEYKWILDRGAPHYAPDGTFLGYFGGCAELSEQNAVSRHAALGTSLVKMRGFARSMAAGQSFEIGEPSDDMTLETATRRLVLAHEADRAQIEHAAGEIKKLARDMAAFGEIGPGTCLTDAGKPPG